MSNTDWEGVGKWYDQIVGDEGHYYHKQIIIPKLLKWFDFQNYPSPSLLDLACGQGVLARHLPSHVSYCGIDLSSSLIQRARQSKLKHHRFVMGDICKPLPISENNFTHASIILALQNVAHPQEALKQASLHLQPEGYLAIVLNHPCFRIPRQSSWEVDESKKIQYRRVDRYLSPLKIPIQMEPSQQSASPSTLSFHHSISDFSRFLSDAGFAILQIEEWISDKQSEGKRSKMENRARSEFPLFFTFLAQKIPSLKPWGVP